MPEVPSLTAEKERQLNEVLAQYLEAVEAGGTPDRTALLAQHPDLAVELGEFFNNLDGLVRSGSARRLAGKPTFQKSRPCRQEAGSAITRFSRKSLAAGWASSTTPGT